METNYEQNANRKAIPKKLQAIIDKLTAEEKKLLWKKFKQLIEKEE